MRALRCRRLKSKLRGAKQFQKLLLVLKVANKEGRAPKERELIHQRGCQLCIYSINCLSVVDELNCEFERGVLDERDNFLQIIA